MFRTKEKTNEEDLGRSVLGVLRGGKEALWLEWRERRDQVPNEVSKCQGLVDGVRSLDFPHLMGSHWRVESRGVA